MKMKNSQGLLHYQRFSSKEALTLTWMKEEEEKEEEEEIFV
jgi:hypothetical protein